jgi:hypothetical protein
MKAILKILLTKTGMALLCLLESHCFLLAQNIQLSNDINIRSSSNYEILPEVGGSSFLLQEDHHSISLYPLNEKMQWGTKTAIEPPAKNCQVNGYISVDSSVYIYYTLPDSGMVKIIQQRVLLNPITPLPAVTLFRLDKSTKEILNLIVSDDHSQHLIRFGKSFSQLNFYVFDTRLQKLQNLGTANVEDEINKDNYHNQILTNSGAYQLIFNEPFRRDKSHFMYYTSGSGTISTHDFSLNDPLDAIQLINSPVNSKNYLTGLYKNDNNGEQLGIAIMDLDYPNPGEHIIRIPFRDSIIKAFYSDEKSDGDGLTDLIFKNVLIHHDGSMTLIYEQQKEVYRTNMPGRNVFVPGSTSIDYYIENVVIIHIKKDFTPGWQRILLKNQQSYDDEAVYSSYFLHSNPSMIRFLYNDEIRRSNTISEYWITARGDSGRRVLINTDHSDLNLQVRNSTQINARATVLPSIEKNKLRLMKIIFN